MQGSQLSESSRTGECPLRPGLERHLLPSGNADEIVTKASSDSIFGSDGLGFGRTIWTTLVSWLARIGIQEQTGSKPDTTSIENCVVGWGQGPYSSRVFSAEKGVDEDQLDRLISHLLQIAIELGIREGRITDRVLGVFVSTQSPKPYSTWNGIREAKGFKARAEARFRGHIQWQGFVALCGHVDDRGVKHVTPELIRDFFKSEEPFFQQIVDRRQGLRDGIIPLGDKSGILKDAPPHIDLVATDKAYKKNKSGLWMILKIARYMLFSRRSRVGPLPGTPHTGSQETE